MGVAVGGFRQLFQDGQGLAPLVGVGEGAGAGAFGERPHRAQAVAAVAFGLGHGLGRPLAVVLVEVGVQVVHEVHVEDVEPHDVALALVVVVVPSPARRQHQVAGLHVHFLAFHRGVAGAVPLHDEAQGGGGMAVAFGAFPGLHELDGHLDGAGGGLEGGEPGVHQLHGAAFGGLVDVAELDHLAGLHEAGVDHRPAPQVRAQLRRGLALLPVPRQGILRHDAVQLIEPRIVDIDGFAHDCLLFRCLSVIPVPLSVIPAKAGIQAGWGWDNGVAIPPPLDSRFRGNDGEGDGNDFSYTPSSAAASGWKKSWYSSFSFVRPNWCAKVIIASSEVTLSAML